MRLIETKLGSMYAVEEMNFLHLELFRVVSPLQKIGKNQFLNICTVNCEFFWNF